jgi:hypothetical protein
MMGVRGCTRSASISVELLLVGSLFAVGCAKVLGFEAASLDPELGPNSVDSPDADAGRVSNAGPSDAGLSDAGLSDAGQVPDAAVQVHTDDVSARADSGVPDEPAVTLSLDCDAFCGVVLDACPRGEDENYAVYDSTFTCLRQCSQLEQGSLGQDSGNTLACRLTHAQIARDFPGERATSCPAAGPGGDGVCGSNCEGYCTQAVANCSLFADRDACLTQCAEVPDLGGFNVGDIDGNSLQCRLYHLGAALASPTFHCPHAAGQAPCIDE